MGRHEVIAVFGPTAVGKSAVAAALAERLRADGEDPVVVSADALQVYRGLEILTDAPTREERERLEHRLVGFLEVTETFSAGAYARLAHAEIDGLLAAGRRPLVVGGTGLYLRAALAELDLRPPPRPGVRERWQRALERDGTSALHAELARRAPAAAAVVAPTDSRRVLRALELADAGVVTPPVAEDTASQLWTSDTRHPTLLAALVMEREALYARIDARVETMVAAGATEEVRAAAAAGASVTTRGALGFSELEAGDVEAFKRNTRRFARRQLTWLRKLPGTHPIDVTGRPPSDVAAELHERLRA